MARRSRGQRRRHAVQQRKQSERCRAEADDTQRASKLMSLPAELRTQIWTYVFEDSFQELRADAKSCPWPQAVGARCCYDVYSSAPPLLLACKQTYSEALGIYYSTTTFMESPACAISLDYLALWLRSIRAYRGIPIRNIRLSRTANFEDLMRIDCRSDGNDRVVQKYAARLEGVQILMKPYHSGGLRFSSNLWYQGKEAGFEIWTCDAVETDREVREAYKQGPEVLESWLVEQGSAVSRWQIGNASELDELTTEQWWEKVLDAFDEWHMRNYSRVVSFVYGRCPVEVEKAVRRRIALEQERE